MSATLSEVLITAFFFLVATFVIGLSPVFIVRHKGYHDKYIGKLSLFGMGMLLGTSFMLVIPEGVKACLEHHGNVGLNLLIGYLCVHLLDRAVSWVSERDITERNPSAESFKTVLNPRTAFLNVVRNNVVFALVVHGLSDGLALGASVDNKSLKITMLVAIVIHKIPAVLSLTSIMISRQKLPLPAVISNLAAFAASTPIGYLVISILSVEHFAAMEWISGNLLLMSGGSLLYASFTAFSGSDSHSHGVSHGNAPKSTTDGFVMISNSDDEQLRTKDMTPMNFSVEESQPKVLPSETGLVLLGVLIPAIISFCVNDD
ncbi:LAMI_0C03180g1_1 [Lachancea mirantina]|uniref:LAMI_0C03180g1_1 n=1 Tax=Lachancea mirantina TaxID=1230905 RepID=A0A1G4J1E6_9SACH|nr:LAMI_0C03180g1_1 [Lachancea mirantina]